MVYLLVVLSLLSVKADGETALYNLAAKFGLGPIIVIGAVAATFSASNGAMFGGARTVYSMFRGKNGLGVLNSRNVPGNAIIVLTFISAVLVWMLPVDAAAEFSSVVFLLAFLMVNFVGALRGVKTGLPGMILILFILLTTHLEAFKTLALLFSVLISLHAFADSLKSAPSAGNHT